MREILKTMVLAVTCILFLFFLLLTKDYLELAFMLGYGVFLIFKYKE